MGHSRMVARRMSYPPGISGIFKPCGQILPWYKVAMEQGSVDGHLNPKIGSRCM